SFRRRATFERLGTTEASEPERPSMPHPRGYAQPNSAHGRQGFGTHLQTLRLPLGAPGGWLGRGVGPASRAGLGAARLAAPTTRDTNRNVLSRGHSAVWVRGWQNFPK